MSGGQVMGAAAAKRRCLSLIEEHHGDLLIREDDRFRVDVNVWSPAGLVWRATDCHSLSAFAANDRRYAWTGLLEDLLQGVARCDQENCETCQEDEERERADV